MPLEILNPLNAALRGYLKMKHCPTCKEDFADKFGFCPVDGTPLNGHVPTEDKTTPSADAVDVNKEMRSESEEPSSGLVPVSGGYHLTMLEDEGLTRRLVKVVAGVAEQSRLTWPEFKRDPLGFSKRFVVGYSTLAWRTVTSPNVALSAFSAVLAVALLIVLGLLPYKAIYKWMISDGKLVATINMPLEEVRKKSSLTLPNPQPVQQSEEGTSFSTVSSTNQVFDLEIANTGLILEWCKAYTLKVDNNDGQKIKIIDVDLAKGSMDWNEFKLFVNDFAQVLKDSKWRPGINSEGYSEDEALFKTIQGGAPANGEVGTYRWMDKSGLIVLRLSTRMENSKIIPHAQIEDMPKEELLTMLTVPEQQQKVEEGPAGTAKGQGGGQKPKFEKPAGGGGGGRNELKEASAGKLPTASLEPQIKAPEVIPPPIKNPSLPVAATIKADPTLFPPDNRPIAYGDPKSKSNDPSSGQGTGGGIGSGTGGGVGSGEGGGVGPGRGGNTGGGDFGVGGGGAGGGGGGDYSRVFSSKEVTKKVTILSKPEPGYTEEARKNNVTGTVQLRAVFSASGQVTNVVPLKRLPDGLTEKAIAAARQIKFTPAMKDGRAVSSYVTLEYTFNIY
jgi:TonB family protein